MNFTERILTDQPTDATAIIERSQAGKRREWSFPAVGQSVMQIAGALHAAGVRRGDVVMTLIGNRPAWVFAMLAAFRQGYVVLPCNEQLRAKDLRQRLHAVDIAAIIADPRNRGELERAGIACPVLWTDELENTRSTPPVAGVGLDDPALMTFTSGTSGQPKCVVHAHRYLWGQRLQGEHWMAVRRGDRVWCTAASGWSKSARTASSLPGCAARPRCCTTGASTPKSG